MTPTTAATPTRSKPPSPLPGPAGLAASWRAGRTLLDEPCAALGPAETRMVLETIKRLKAEGIGIFLISHEMHDVFEVCERATVMKNGRVVGTVRTNDVTQDEVLQMIIQGKRPQQALTA